MRVKSDNNSPTKAQVAEFDMLFPIVKAVYNEMKELSKKQQNDNLNVKKVQIINRILTKVKAILNKDPCEEFLDILDEDTLPTNSDTVLIITQYIAAMEQYKDKHYYYDDIGLHIIWHTRD